MQLKTEAFKALQNKDSSKTFVKILIRTLYALREKCPYSELFWSAFSRIRAEYGEILCISPYSIRMRENADQNNSEYGHFLRSDGDAIRRSAVIPRNFTGIT